MKLFVRLSILAICVQLFTGCILGGELEFEVTQRGAEVLGLPAGLGAYYVAFSDAFTKPNPGRLSIADKTYQLEGKECVNKKEGYECRASSLTENGRLFFTTIYKGSIAPDFPRIIKVEVKSESGDILIQNTKPQPFWH